MTLRELIKLIFDLRAIFQGPAAAERHYARRYANRQVRRWLR